MATLRFHKEGDWEDCAIMLNGLVGVPKAINDGLLDIAWGIIVPAIDTAKASGDYVANAEATVRKKGFNHPWVDGSQSRSAGQGTAFRAGGGGVQAMLSGDAQVIGWVNNGTDRAPARPLFEQAWNNCRAEVEAAVDALLASAMASAGAGGGGRARYRDARGRFTGYSAGRTAGTSAEGF